MYDYLSDKGYLRGEGYSDIELFKNVRAGLTAGDCEDLGFEIFICYLSIMMMHCRKDPLVHTIKRILKLFVVAMTGGVATLPSLGPGGHVSDQRIFHIFDMALPRSMLSRALPSSLSPSKPSKPLPKYEWESALNCLVLEGTNLHEVDFSHRVPPQKCPLPPNKSEWYRSHMAMLEVYQKNKSGAEVGAEPPSNPHFSCFYRDVIFFWSPDISEDCLEFMVCPKNSPTVYGVNFEDVIVGNFVLTPTHVFPKANLDFYRELISMREVLPQYKTASFKATSHSKSQIKTSDVQMSIPLRSMTPMKEDQGVFFGELRLDQLRPLYLQTVNDFIVEPRHFMGPELTGGEPLDHSILI